ncbi:hypothetical protein B9479_003145 [Cryptococcus floricola]|uniref:Uncharacterized protein n=1 Tax=Cryptococcus floricola TaxID=2591691 RepID=A0A5D3B145_9TREE|nr:hypothetical protein B9479_003145 [Cryptococcus floricola]
MPTFSGAHTPKPSLTLCLTNGTVLYPNSQTGASPPPNNLRPQGPSTVDNRLPPPLVLPPLHGYHSTYVKTPGTMPTPHAPARPDRPPHHPFSSPFHPSRTSTTLSKHRSNPNLRPYPAPLSSPAAAKDFPRE